MPQEPVSLIHLTGDQRLLDVFQESVRQTMQEFGSGSQDAGAEGGANEERVTGNLVYGSSWHLTSRPVGGVPDPICTRTALSSMPLSIRLRTPGKRSVPRLDAGRSVFRGAFHARLSRAVTQLVTVSNAPRTAGGCWVFAPDPGKKYSRRTAQIEEVGAGEGHYLRPRKSPPRCQDREKKNESRSFMDLQTGMAKPPHGR